MKQILTSSFYQLFLIYTIAIALITFDFVWKYKYHLEWFALIIALLGTATIINRDTPFTKPLLIISIFFVLLTRTLPSHSMVLPLGYDSGIYRSAIFHYFSLTVPDWMQGMQPPGLFTITSSLLSLNITVDQLLIPLFIFFNLLTILFIYLVGKAYFNESVGVLATLFFAVSIAQFRAFELMYYKNIVAMSVMLFLLYTLQKEKYALSAIVGGFLGGLHQPTFLIFGLSYFLQFITTTYSIKNKSWSSATKKRFFTGLFILIIAVSMHATTFAQAITPYVTYLATSIRDVSLDQQVGGGTFINFFTYQYLSLAYLPLALLGFFLLIKNRNFNFLFWWGVVNGAIVYFKLFFFNRFIIHLDLLFVILSGYALYHLLCSKKWFTIFISVILIGSMGFAVYKEARDATPLIRHHELDIIKSLQYTEPNAKVMSTTSYYSPWLEGYSNKPTIAPGLFDEDQWNLSTWQLFWRTNNSQTAKTLLSNYTRPIYIFNGEFGGRIAQQKFENDSCFTEWYNDQKTRIIKYDCT